QEAVEGAAGRQAPGVLGWRRLPRGGAGKFLRQRSQWRGQAQARPLQASPGQGGERRRAAQPPRRSRLLEVRAFSSPVLMTFTCISNWRWIWIICTRAPAASTLLSSTAPVVITVPGACSNACCG